MRVSLFCSFYIKIQFTSCVLGLELNIIFGCCTENKCYIQYIYTHIQSRTLWMKKYITADMSLDMTWMLSFCWDVHKNYHANCNKMNANIISPSKLFDILFCVLSVHSYSSAVQVCYQITFYCNWSCNALHLKLKLT